MAGSAILITTILLGSYVVTPYRSVPNQTDSTPYNTSTGEHVCCDGVAVSPDWITSGRLKMGDWILIEGVGLKRVNDVMAARWKNRLDVWVPSYNAEHRFFTKHKYKPLKIWKVRVKL